MPRSRTAWLSVCLSSLGWDISHEGLRDHESFEDWAKELDARRASAAEAGGYYSGAGDSNPALVYWIDDLLERWPAAKFVVIAREESECLEAFVAAVPTEEQRIRMGWGGYVAAFKGACDRLRAREVRDTGGASPDVRCSRYVQRNAGTLVRFCLATDLAADSVLLDIAEFVTGRRPEALWARRMQRLRVTSIIESVAGTVQPPKVEAIKVPPLDGFDTTGLSAALYRNADFEIVAAWWQQHQGQPLMQAALPPFGVVVSDQEGPAAALWAYECYGVPVAELAFPVTRPGVGLKRAAAALSYAVAACIAGIGKGHVPEASFRVFKTFAPRGLARYLKRLGFRDALTERVAMTLTL